jgi:hypothetical protein
VPKPTAPLRAHIDDNDGDYDDDDDDDDNKNNIAHSERTEY